VQSAKISIPKIKSTFQLKAKTQNKLKIHQRIINNSAYNNIFIEKPI